MRWRFIIAGPVLFTLRGVIHLSQVTTDRADYAWHRLRWWALGNVWPK